MLNAACACQLPGSPAQAPLQVRQGALRVVARQPQPPQQIEKLRVRAQKRHRAFQQRQRAARVSVFRQRLGQRQHGTPPGCAQRRIRRPIRQVAAGELACRVRPSLMVQQGDEIVHVAQMNRGVRVHHRQRAAKQRLGLAGAVLLQSDHAQQSQQIRILGRRRQQSLVCGARLVHFAGPMQRQRRRDPAALIDTARRCHVNAFLSRYRTPPTATGPLQQAFAGPAHRP